MQRFLVGVMTWIVLSSGALAQSLPSKRGIFVAPGAFVAPDAYEALVIRLSKHLGDSPETYIASYLGGFPTIGATNRQLEDFYKSIADQGYEPDITVLGHSQGGLSTANLPKGRYARIVLMASYVQADWTKRREFLWDKPVLSLGGTLDPLTLPERIAYDSFLWSKSHPFTAVILEGVNHFHFANSRLTRGDRESPLDTEQALDEITTVIAAFIRNDLDSFESEPKGQASSALVTGYEQSLERDETACRDAQFAHLGVTDSATFDIRLKSYAGKQFYPQFVLDKSYIETAENKSTIGVYQFIERRIGILDIAPLQPITPELIACKMRSAEAVSVATGKDYSGHSCAQENLAIFQHAFRLLPTFRQDRLRQRGIDPLLDQMPRDIDTSRESLMVPGLNIVNQFRSRGDQWALGSFLRAYRQETGITVETASVTTPVGDPNNLFLGAYYCKLVAPSRAFQLLDEGSR